MTDTSLVEKIKSGDQAAFNDLVKQHQDFVLNVCFRFLGNREDAQDATQEVFIKVYFAMQQYAPNAKISTWIYRIAVNYCLNYKRSQKRKKQFFSFSTLQKEKENVEMVADTNNDPEQNLHDAEKQKLVQQALAKLNDEQRTAIILHRYQGQSYKEIAEIMQTTTSSVESRIFRAKQQLAKYLKEYMI